MFIWTKVVLRTVCQKPMRIPRVGERCYDRHAWQAKGRKNAIGAVIGLTFLTLSLFDTTINAAIFYAWLTQDLLPKTPIGSVIVMDNASFHKREEMMTVIQDHGSTVEFLPSYTPDLNPIEGSS